MCRGRAKRSASGAGFSTGRPMTGSTISANFAGCAVARNTPTPPSRLPAPPGLPAPSAPGTQSRCADRADSRALVDPPDRRRAPRRRVTAAGDVAAHRVAIAAVQPRHALEVARVADVHRVRQRLHRRRAARSGRSSRYSGTTSLTFVAATNRAIGRPARFAISPAVRLPKLPLGVRDDRPPSAGCVHAPAARRRGSSRPSAAAAGRC